MSLLEKQLAPPGEDRPPTMAERYASAARSGDLTPHLDRRTDADVLLAAGIAASKDPRKMLALNLYRMRITGDMTGLFDVVDRADGWMAHRLAHKGNRPMASYARRQLVADILSWWLDPVCGYCEGRMFVKVEDAARLSTVACESCHGAGHRPLARSVPHAHVKHAQWLADELDKLVLIITGEMARLLGTRIKDLEL